MKKILFLCFSILALANINAQELLYSVTINTPKLQTTDPKVFGTLKTTMEEFLNNNKWTDDVFEQDERIKCNIQMTIKEEVGTQGFKADFALQATRPVYGSDYETQLINHVDKDVVFTYQQYQPLQYSKSVYVDNLSSILSFYSYMILGLDYDSFSPYGGEIYFQTAQEIVNLAPKNGDLSVGWAASDKGRTRYLMIENVLNPRLRPMRQAWYDYHRKGLDVASQNVAQCNLAILQVMDDLEKVSTAQLNAMIIQMFVNSKSNELIEIFKGASQPQKQRLNQIMLKLDPANGSKYREIGL